MEGQRQVLMLVENAPIPGDPRVWNEACTLRDAGYQVCIIAPRKTREQASSDLVDGIFVYRFNVCEAQGFSLSYIFEYACAFWRIFWLSLKVWRRHGFTILHVANPPDLFILVGLFYRCSGCKFIFDQHDLAPDLFRVIFSDRYRWLYRVLCLLERCTYRFADAVIVPNQSFACNALERGKCWPGKVFVVRNGPDMDYMLSCTLLTDLPFPNKRRYVLAYAGTMGEQDGVQNALYALRDLVYIYGHRDVSAILIGSGSALGELRELSHRLDLDEYVFFTGWLAERQVFYSYLALADIGLVPDPQNGLNERCTMVKVMDYMAMGLPVVAFDLAETRISADEAALYAKPNDCADFAYQLECLLSCADLRCSLGARGRKRVEELLNSEHSSKTLLAAYEALSGGREVAQA